VDLDDPAVVVGGTGRGCCCCLAVLGGGGGMTFWKERPSKTRPYLPVVEMLMV